MNRSKGNLSIGSLPEGVTLPSYIDEIDDEKSPRPSNRPELIRQSLRKYLRNDFAYGLTWTHPITSAVYTEEQIKSALAVIRKYLPEVYNPLWLLIHTGQGCDWIAANFGYSSSTLRRWRDAGYTRLLFILMYPDLTPEITLQLRQ